MLPICYALPGILAEWAAVIVPQANADILRGRDDKKGIVCYDDGIDYT